MCVLYLLCKPLFVFLFQSLTQTTTCCTHTAILVYVKVAEEIPGTPRTRTLATEARILSPTHKRPFLHHLAEFLTTTAHFVRDSPHPRLWCQPDSTSPVITSIASTSTANLQSHTPSGLGASSVSDPSPALSHVPSSQHALLFTSRLHRDLVASSAVAVARGMDLDLLQPAALWLAAYDAAKVSLRSFVISHLTVSKYITGNEGLFVQRASATCFHISISEQTSKCDVYHLCIM